MDCFQLAEMVSHFMLENVRYASPEQRLHSRENGYWWKTPEETLEDGFGFCYDLAAFALNALESIGLTEAQLLFVAWGHWGIESNTGHFVCTYCVEGAYYSIDNGILNGPFSFDQLLSSASRNRDIWSYRYFKANQIPYHIKYRDMTNFAETR